MAIFLTTTGTQSPVIFPDLGGRTFTHPTTDYEITLEYEIEEIRDSQSMALALANGYISLKDEEDNVITDVKNLDDRNADSVDGINIDLTGIQDGDSIKYDAVNEKFIPAPDTSGVAQYIDLYDATGNLSVAGAWVDVPWDIERKKDSNFLHVANSAEIEFASEGTYVMFFRATTAISSGTGRSESQIRIVLDSGSGYVEYPGTRATMYNRTQSEGKNTGVAFAVIVAGAGWKVKGQVIQSSGTSTMITDGNGSSFMIFQAKGERGDDGQVYFQNEGTPIIGGPHDTINFVGQSVNAVDGGNGVVNLTFNIISELAAVQARNTSANPLTSAWSDILLDDVVLTTNSNVIERNAALTQRIDIKSDGFYMISYSGNGQSEIAAQVTKNGISIPTSYQSSGYDPSSIPARFFVGNTFIESCSAGDYLVLQMSAPVFGTSVAGYISIAVVKMDGVKGDKGEKGDTGDPGPGSTINVWEEGVAVPNSPFGTVDFTGDAVEVTDGGGGRAVVNITRATLPVYGTEFQYAENLSPSTTSSTAYVTKVTLTTTDLPAGLYRIGFTWAWNHASISNDALFRTRLNGADLGLPTNIEPKDSSTYYPETRFFYRNLNGVNTLELQYGNEGSSTTIQDAVIELWRVS